MLAITPLTASQLFRSALVGAILWFAAALLIRFIEPMGAFDQPMVALTYLLLVPGTVPVVLLLRAVAGLAKNQTGLGMAAGTGMAALLDGVALTWFPALYGDNPAAAGAAILFGGGVGLVLGFLMSGD